jgi:hypothetical protein
MILALGHSAGDIKAAAVPPHSKATALLHTKEKAARGRLWGEAIW